MLRFAAHPGPRGVGAPADRDTGGHNSDEVKNERSREAAMAMSRRPGRGNGTLDRSKAGLWYIEWSKVGKRAYHSWADSHDWDEARVHREADYVMERVRRGHWPPAD